MVSRTQQIIFVTGKGGVGKSTVAAAIACREAKAGRRVLLAELGDYSYYEKFFHLPPLTYKPQGLAPNWDVALWTGETCLREYVLHYLKVEKIYQMFFENRIMKTFVNAAPGVAELAILGKITSGIRKIGPPMNYDLIVVDAYSTGHFLSLLQAPKGLSEAVRSGPFGEQSAAIVNVLKNPNQVGYLIVTLPEPLPVQESKELLQNLKSEFALEPSLICNRLLSSQLSEKDFVDLKNDPQLQQPGTQKYFKYLEFIQHRQEKNLKDLKEIHGEFSTLPLVTDAKDVRALVEKISEHIAL